LRIDKASEHQEQKNLFEWVRLSVKKYPALSNLAAIPNGGHRHKAVAGKLKAEGVSAGFPDLICAFPSRGFHGLFIEMKVKKGGRVSPAQKEWIDRLLNAGYLAVVCKGFLEARDMLIWYLTEGKENGKP
jgi:hypothetical protein